MIDSMRPGQVVTLCMTDDRHFFEYVVRILPDRVVVTKSYMRQDVRDADKLPENRAQ
jgi:hypothetical protein